MSSIPPPPLLSQVCNIRKRKKRFVLSEQNTLSQNTDPIGYRVQIIPHLHYGLERFSSKFALLDKDNPLTHSPTLISVGGCSIYAGGIEDRKLFYLDLEPSFVNDGSMNVEYEWKELDALNSQLIDLYSLRNRISFLYCKKRQSLLLFCFNSTLEFSLKTREWKAISEPFTDFRTHHYFDVNEEYLLRIQTGETVDLYPFEQLFPSAGSTMSSAVGLHMNFDIKQSIQVIPNTIVPLIDRKEIKILSTLYRDRYQNYPTNPEFITLSLQDQSVTSSPIFENLSSKANYIEIPELSNSINSSPSEYPQSHSLMISLNNNYSNRMMLYWENIPVNGTGSELLPIRHNPLPIEVTPHLLFSSCLFGYISKKNERRAVLLPGNDLLFVIKLDYMKIENAFPFLTSCLSLNSFTDFSITFH